MRIIYGVDMSYRYAVYQHPERPVYYVFDHKKKKVVSEHDSGTAAKNHSNWMNEAEASFLRRGMGKAALGTAMGAAVTGVVGHGVAQGLGKLASVWKKYRQAKIPKHNMQDRY